MMREKALSGAEPALPAGRLRAAAAPEDAAAARPRPAPRRADGGLTFDRALFLRHVAIFAGAVGAYVQQQSYGVGWAVFAIVSASAALNFACSFLYRRPHLELLAGVASSVIGVGCWTGLAVLTGGVASPFIAGLWLEIFLAAMLFALAGIVSVTAWSVAALFALQSSSGLGGPPSALAFHTAFLIVMGSLAYAVARRALRTEADLTSQRDALDDRLRALADELEQARELGRFGENVARLAHGLKNAVHSLRGFAGLIEPTLGERSDARAALRGLRVAIDDLEALARLTLDAPRERAAAPSGCASPAAVAQRALGEVGLAHPGVAFSLEGAGADAAVALDERELFELLVILLRNAAEALGARGEARLLLRREGGELRIAVRDTGPGIPPEQRERVFEPGFTTKPQGSGYGLFLARRIVAPVGGRIAAHDAPGGGSEIEVALPLCAEARTR
jgi:signal transduction histidine kinase